MRVNFDSLISMVPNTTPTKNSSRREQFGARALSGFGRQFGISRRSDATGLWQPHGAVPRHSGDLPDVAAVGGKACGGCRECGLGPSPDSPRIPALTSLGRDWLDQSFPRLCIAPRIPDLQKQSRVSHYVTRPVTGTDTCGLRKRRFSIR